jgi:predicted RNA-binding protein
MRTEKQFIKLVEKYGGTVFHGSVDFPDTLRINTKSEALDLLDILINNKDREENIYTIDLDPPLIAIREALKRNFTPQETKDDPPETAQEQGGDIEEEEPLHLFDVDPAGLQRMFRDFDEAMEQRESA